MRRWLPRTQIFIRFGAEIFTSPIDAFQENWHRSWHLHQLLARLPNHIFLRIDNIRNDIARNYIMNMFPIFATQSIRILVLFFFFFFFFFTIFLTVFIIAILHGGNLPFRGTFTFRRINLAQRNQRRYHIKIASCKLDRNLANIVAEFIKMIQDRTRFILHFLRTQITRRMFLFFMRLDDIVIIFIIMRSTSNISITNRATKSKLFAMRVWIRFKSVLFFHKHRNRPYIEHISTVDQTISMINQR
mmetsp:Transcript_26580/g.43496  ORF Transcript_26580/g.43496 Transcript_26580/m.43496 type:complete len:245 (-) Transcript_26580:844-1578(-)